MVWLLEKFCNFALVIFGLIVGTVFLMIGKALRWDRCDNEQGAS